MIIEEILNQWNSFLSEHKDDVKSAAGILLFSKDGKVLLSKRSSEVPHPGTIGTIGGHLTKGEEPSIGAKREFYEEAGFKGPFTGFSLLHTQKDDGFSYYTFLASTDKADKEFKPLEAYEHEIVWNKWLDFEEIKDSKNLHPGLTELFGIKKVVEEIREFIKGIK